jgi:pyruvate/2-oxoacid:ferredoxin oxidoreductase alpha subunit
MAFPRETLTHRLDLDAAMRAVPAVLEEHRAQFKAVFGREVSGALSAYRVEDADRIFVASGTIATTLKDVIDERRAKGEKVGMIRIKLFRPFPAQAFVALCGSTPKIGVLDRNYSAGTGGIFWQEIRACLQGQGDRLVQGYLAGVGGGDVVPEMVNEVVDDLSHRTEAGDPVWKGIDQ